MKRTLWMNLVALLAAGICRGEADATGSNREAPNVVVPNVVVIVSDDQGYGDASCYDHAPHVATPNIDRLASSGVRLTSGYASAYVCAPTRAGLLTGRYQQRFGFYTAGDSRVGLPRSEITIADVLKKRGYATGVFGKWHLGLELPYHPLKRGFDTFYGFLGHGAHDYFKLEKTDDHASIYRDLERVSDTGYLTDNLGREAVSFIERHRDKPFFLYLPFNAVHWPLQAPAADIRRFKAGSSERNTYLAMLHRMDLAIGKVLDALERSGRADNTLVIFFSDNGGARKNHANNGKLRDFKQSVYEGGVRVPFIVRWPASLPRGAVCHEPVSSLDVFPTICAAVGIDLPDDRAYDGKNFLPVLTGPVLTGPVSGERAAGPLHEALFWDGDGGKQAVRAGKWKWINNRGRIELYDLESDLSEATDLAGKRPDVVERLGKTFRAWRSAMAPRIGTRQGADSAQRKKR
ncbi:MAG: sulfatase-like hydrolase/transferase, partial [Gemmatimonadales bacterium]